MKCTLVAFAVIAAAVRANGQEVKCTDLKTHSECNSKANCFFSNKCEKFTKCSDLKLLSQCFGKRGNKIVTPSVMSRGAAVNCQWDFVSRKCAQFKDTVQSLTYSEASKLNSRSRTTSRKAADGLQRQGKVNNIDCSRLDKVMCMNFDRVCRWNNFVRVRKRDSEGNIPSKPGKIYTVTRTKEDDNGDIIQYQGSSRIGIEGVDTYKVTGLNLGSKGCKMQKMPCDSFTRSTCTNHRNEMYAINKLFASSKYRMTTARRKVGQKTALGQGSQARSSETGRCKWVPNAGCALEGVSDKACFRRKGQKECEADKNKCAYAQRTKKCMRVSSMSKLCDRHDGKPNDCADDKKCKYDLTRSYCIRNSFRRKSTRCSMIKKQSECRADAKANHGMRSACEWKSNKCDKVVCSTKGYSSCNNDKYNEVCEWDNHRKQSCFDKGTKAKTCGVFKLNNCPEGFCIKNLKKGTCETGPLLRRSPVGKKKMSCEMMRLYTLGRKTAASAESCKNVMATTKTINNRDGITENLKFAVTCEYDAEKKKCVSPSK